MTEDEIETDIPGKFNAAEEAILEYLYVHPGKTIGTKSLIRAFKPHLTTIKQQQQAYEETQSSIETLIADELVRGKRVCSSGRVCFEKLRLTQKGEVAAIKERKRERKFVISIRDIGTKK
jgi:hypothetical protein